MKFGMFIELQYPRPWLPDGERKLFQEVLDQAELADKLGYDYLWEVEHHFLEEYAHSSSPEVFLAAASQRTKRMRLAHGIVLMPPPYNPTPRVAERIATLDLVSNGRVDFGVGESSSRGELEGFNIPLEEKRDMFLEATEQVANMLALDPYPGYNGKYVKMPCRNIVPKVIQKPHPPMWMACSSREAVRLAARLGLGAIAVVFISPAEAKDWVDEYYHLIKTECVPIGHTVNPNICILSQMFVDKSNDRAREKGIDGSLFFQLSVAHHYAFGVHKPGRTDLWSQFQQVRNILLKALPPDGGWTCIGTSEHAREVVKAWGEAGVDQLAFILQGGKVKHRDICDSLEMFAAEVMGEAQKGEEERQEKKMKQLQPYIEQALARKKWMRPLSDEEIPKYVAYKRPIAKGRPAKGAEIEEDAWQAASWRIMDSVGLAPPNEDR